MTDIQIWLNSDKQMLSFDIPIERVNYLRKISGVGVFGGVLNSDFAVADVIEAELGWQEFMYRGYAAVMREALGDVS